MGAAAAAAAAGRVSAASWRIAGKGRAAGALEDDCFKRPAVTLCWLASKLSGIFCDLLWATAQSMANLSQDILQSFLSPACFLCAGARVPAAAAARRQAALFRTGPALQRGALQHRSHSACSESRLASPRESSSRARTMLRATLTKDWRVHPKLQARAASGVGGLGLLARQDLAAAAPVAAVLEAPRLFALMRALLQAGTRVDAFGSLSRECCGAPAAADELCLLSRTAGFAASTWPCLLCARRGE